MATRYSAFRSLHALFMRDDRHENRHVNPKIEIVDFFILCNANLVNGFGHNTSSFNRHENRHNSAVYKPVTLMNDLTYGLAPFLPSDPDHQLRGKAY
jgi:hypothetical protein